MTDPTVIPLTGYPRLTDEQMHGRAEAFAERMRHRRSVRQFSSEPVAREVLEQCIRAAGSAPSGANRQPWHFVVVSDADVKRQIRLAAEQRERRFYEKQAPEEWLDALAPLGTNWSKPFLEAAPYLIVVFLEPYGLGPNGEKTKNYYVRESVGLATGVLLAALHEAGLASLTYTPPEMRFLRELLGRGENERPFLVVVTGRPAEDATVPDIRRKGLGEIATCV
jgi:nitroreductase